MRRLGFIISLWVSVTPWAAAANPPAETSAPAATKAKPQAELRLVTIGGTISEIVCELGFCQQIVGRDLTSQYPERLKNKPNVGYFRSLSAEGILNLKPDLVLVTEMVTDQAVLTQLQTAGIKIQRITEDKTVAGAKKRIRQVAAALNRKDQGDELVSRMQSALKTSRTRHPAKPKPRVLFIYARGANHLHVAGRETAPARLIRLAGGEPAVTAFTGYKPLTPEAVLKAQPDVVLMTTKGASSLGRLEDFVAGIPGMKFTPAVRHKRFVLMDDLLLLGFGPRLPQAVDELAQKLRQLAGKTHGTTATTTTATTAGQP
jgi:iron complex transport system substrate-binding protein